MFVFMTHLATPDVARVFSVTKGKSKEVLGYSHDLVRKIVITSDHMKFWMK